MADTIRIGGPDGVDRLRERLADRASILTSIGAALVAQSRQAFEDQRLGDVIWPERYPAQKEPFINIAPVLARANEGRTPTTDDFRRRPALGGSDSELARSIAFRVEGVSAVEVGTNKAEFKPELFQSGGASSIPITATARKVLQGWLLTGGTKKPAKGGGHLGTGRKLSTRKVTGSSATRAEFAKKLAFIFDEEKDELNQGAYARPFIGFGDTTLAEIEDELVLWIGAA